MRITGHAAAAAAAANMDAMPLFLEGTAPQWDAEHWRRLLIPSLVWSMLWVACLVIPPGSQHKVAIFRTSLVHGVLSTAVAALKLGLPLFGLHDVFPLDTPAVMACSFSYFVVDILNMALNDHIWRAKCYQKPINRALEYSHHAICLVGGTIAHAYLNSLCLPVHESSPFTYFMLNEFSTPFLILYRTQGGGRARGLLFLFTFFLSRILLNFVVLLPSFLTTCHFPVISITLVPFQLIQVIFFIQIIRIVLNPKDARMHLPDHPENPENPKNVQRRTAEKSGKDD